MKLWLAKRRGRTTSGLVPTDEDGRAFLDRFGDGECCQVEIVRPRSVQWNRMYWGLCRAIGENQDPPRDEESVDAELRILSGHYDVMYVEGHEVRVPKRIAFQKMSADEWAEYWQRAEVAVSERFGAEYLPEMAA